MMHRTYSIWLSELGCPQTTSVAVAVGDAKSSSSSSSSAAAATAEAGIVTATLSTPTDNNSNDSTIVTRNFRAALQTTATYNSDTRYPRHNMDQVINVSTNLLNATIGTAAWTLKPVLKIIESGAKSLSGGQGSQTVVVREIYSLPPNMRKWAAIVGIMGASALAMGTYGAHVFYPRKEIADKRKAVFETANKYHFLHSLAIMCVPFVRKPNLSGSLFIIGTVVFSGSCYLLALRDDPRIGKYAPFGGTTLFLAWLSLAL